MMVGRQVRLIALASLIATAAYCSYQVIRIGTPQCTLAFLNVGQGKCILIIAPNGNTLMVDAGTQPYGQLGVGERCAKQQILPTLLRMGVRRLHVIAVTHPDKDHCNAVPILVRELRPLLFWLPVGDSSELDWQAVRAAVQEKNIRTIVAQLGQRLWLDARHKVFVEVLGPPDGMVVKVSDWSPNDASTVFKVRFGRITALLTGDIGATGQRWLLQSGADLRATILDVPHHGSKHNLETFLVAVRPKVAVISAGRQNPFGHPALETVAVLRRMGATIWVTGEQGSLLIRTNGQG